MRSRLRRRPVVSALLALTVVLVAGGASAEYVRVRSERVALAAITAELKSAIRVDSTAGVLDAGVRAFYADRADQPAWLSPDDRGVALGLLRAAPDDALPVDSAVAALAALSDSATTAPSLGRLDLDLTAALVRFGHALSQPRVDARALYGINWTPALPDSADVAAALADALVAREPEAPLAEALDAWAEALRPQHPGYRRLRAALARERALADSDLTLDRDLAPGDSSAAVVTLRQRLAVEGVPLGDELRPRFDEALSEALGTVQRRLGLTASGRLDRATRDALNRRRPELIPLLALNLERWRWLPRDLGDLHIWVNVPRYELALMERTSAGWTEAIRFRSVVGASDWQTPAFTDTLQTIVFNPTWIVPASIQRESYGEVRGYVVREPGPGNAMGRVKFLFPNDHAVYVHDTPTKWAFGVDDRARSHGCIRAGDPEGLARELLTRTNGWEAERVADIFRGSWYPTQSVTVEATVPVHLVYFTAAVDPNGRIVVFDDIYHRDARLAAALGLDYVPLPPTLRADLIADAIGDEVEEEEEEPATEDDPSEPEVETDTLAVRTDTARAEQPVLSATGLR